MRRAAIGLLIALLGIAALAGIAFASSGGSPSPQEGDTAGQQGWLGASIANINRRLADHFGLTVDSGVVIVKVAPQGPADVAGLQGGDVVLSINGEAMADVDQVVDTIRALGTGTVVTVTVLRDGEEVTVEATLTARPQPLVPSYLKGLLGRGFTGNLLHADVEILDDDGTVITVGLTLGTVKSTPEGGLLTIVRKDGVETDFSIAADTGVIVGGHSINLEGLKEDTPVLVVEKDGAVRLVVAWPGDLMPRFKGMPAMPWRQKPFHRGMPYFTTPNVQAVPDSLMPQFRGMKKLVEPEAFGGMLGNRIPGPGQLRTEWYPNIATPSVQSEATGASTIL